MTNEELIQLRAKYGVPETGYTSNTPTVDRTAELDAAWGVETPPKPTFAERVKTDITGAGKKVQETISGEGENASKSPLRRGVEATATAFSTVPKVISEVLPQPIRKGIEQVGEKIGEGFTAVTDKIADTELFKGAVQGDTSKLEDTLGIASGAGEIAGNILSANATAKTLQKGADITKKGITIAKEKVSTIAKDRAIRKVLEKTSKDLQKTVDMTSDVLNKEERIQAIKEGRGVSPTRFDRGALQASERDIQRANLVKDVITSKDLNTNISNAASEIKNISENKIKPFLKKNPNYYEPKDLVDYMDRKVQPSMSIKNNPQALKIFNQIKKKALAIAQKNPADTEGILDARKVLDSFIKKEFGDTVFQEAQSTAIKQAPIQARNAFNDFIADSLKYKGNIGTVNKIEDILSASADRGIKFDSIESAREALQKAYGVTTLPEDAFKEAFFRYNMKKMHALYEAVDNMSIKAEQGLNASKAEAAIKKFGKDNPIKTRVGKAVTGGAVTASVLGL